MGEQINNEDVTSRRVILDPRHIGLANNSDIVIHHEDSDPKYLRVFVGDSFSYLHPVTASSTQNVKWLALAAVQRYNSTTSVGGSIRLRENRGSTGSLLPEDVIDEATGKIIPPSETLLSLVKYLSSNNHDVSTFPVRVRLMSDIQGKSRSSPNGSKHSSRKNPMGGLSASSPLQARSPGFPNSLSTPLVRSGKSAVSPTQISSAPNSAFPSRATTPARSAPQSQPQPFSPKEAVPSSLTLSKPNSTITPPSTRRSLWQACAFNMSAGARDAAITLATQTRSMEKQRISALRAKAEASYAREIVSQVLSLNDYMISTGDSELVFAHALEQEWEFIRVHVFVSSPADIRLIKATMLKCWSALNELYRHFSASELGVPADEDDTSSTMQIDEFIHFALVAGLSPPLTRASLENIFRRANANRSQYAALGGDDGDEESMARYEWLEALVLLAEASFASDVDLFSGLRLGIARGFEKLCLERLVPLAEQLGAAPLRRILRSKSMLVWLSSRLDALKAVYAYYSAVDQKETERIMEIVAEQFGIATFPDAASPVSSASSPRKTNTGENSGMKSPATESPAGEHSTTLSRTASSNPHSSMGTELVFRFCSDGRYSRTTTGPVRKVELSDVGATGARRQEMNFEKFAASMVHASLAPAFVLSQSDLDAGAINVADEIWEITGKRPRQVLPLAVPVPGELTGRELRRAFNGSQAEDDGTGLDKEDADEEMVFAEWLEGIARVSLAKWGPLCNYNCSWLAEVPPKDKSLMKKALARAQAKRDFRLLGARLLLENQPITLALPPEIAHILLQGGYSLSDRDSIQEVFSRGSLPHNQGMTHRPALSISSKHPTPAPSPMRGGSSTAPSPLTSNTLTPAFSQSRLRPLPTGSFPAGQQGRNENAQEGELDERTPEEIEAERLREEARREEERKRREMRARTVADAIVDKLYEKYHCPVEVPSHLEIAMLTILLQWGFDQVASSVYYLGKGPARIIPRDPIRALQALIAQDAKRVLVHRPIPGRSRPQITESLFSQGFRSSSDATITEDETHLDTHSTDHTTTQRSSPVLSVHGFSDEKDDDSIIALALSTINDIPGFSETSVCKNSSDLFENPFESVAKRAVRPKQAFRLPVDPSSILSPIGFQSDKEYGFSKL